MKLKYVIVDELYPIVFGECFQHKQFSRIGKITSAGFCSISEVETPKERTDISTATMFQVSCYGESVSLGVKVAENDEKQLEYLYNKS
jgi:hypothetical protein